MSRWLLKPRPQAKSPVPLVPVRQSVMFGYRPTDDMMTFLDTYGSDSVVHSIVSRMSQAVSEAKWRLYAKSKTGKEQDRTEITSHAVLDFLNRPNPFQTFAEILAAGEQHYKLVGECSIVLGFQGGLKYPIDMWVLRPDRIQPVPDPYNFLKGWLYSSPGDGEKVPLEVRELMRMRDPSPVDQYRGMGAVQAMLRDLDATKYTKEWQANFFANSAQPGGMLSVDRRLQDDEFEEMSTRWGAQHQGVSKAHRVAILEQAEWVQNSFSLKDLQMAELEALGRDKTLAAFGMPKSMIGIVEDVNRANAEAMEYLFARWLVRPDLVKWREMLNKQLLPLFDPAGKTELDFDDPVPENSEANIAELKTKSDILIAMVNAGFDNSEVAEFLDLPDFEYTKPEVPAFGDGQDGALEGVSSPIQTPDDSPRGAGTRQIDSAMRWVVRGHPDDHCCQPCLDKIGTLYRNRQDAYQDYPPGEGYVNCVGKQFGNHCRCHVAKRRSSRDE